MKKEQLERVCFNCNYFFASRTEASEYGICLELHLRMYFSYVKNTYFLRTAISIL